jgi:DHA1 family bicyclomycin/chloramphenicol resistance-like MFS transporter
MTEARAGKAPLRLLLVLVVATALGPLAMQIVVPALPVMQRQFAVSAATVQLVLSLSALSIALATLAYGPLSDRYGRRPALLGGLAVYLLGSLVCALAGSMSILIAGRIIQAAGGSAGIVLTRAIIRDLYDRDESATMLAYVTMAMVTAPMLAPALGGALIDLVGWRSIFILGGLLGVLVLVVVQRELPETTSPQQGQRGTRHSFLRLMRIGTFWGYAIQLACSLGVFFAFLAAAPFLMVEVLGRPPSEYGLMFVMVSAAFMGGNFVAARMNRRIGLDRMIVIGSIGVLLGCGTLLAFAILGYITPFSLFLPASFSSFSQGLLMPNAQAAAVSVDPQAAGAASGITGFLQMAFAGLIAQIVGSMDDGTAFPAAIGMTLCAAGCLVAALYTGGTRHPA